MDAFAGFPLIDALRQRRSRRFGRGMTLAGGPLSYTSQHAALPLTEDEEALLAFAASGITGHSLADVTYGGDTGGSILAGLVGRTVATGDAIQSVSLVVTNDRATYLLRRPQEYPPPEIPDLIKLAQDGRFTELYRRGRLTIKDGRSAAPVEPIFNVNVNRWSLHVPGSTYFIPVGDLTFLYINGLLEAFDDATRLFILDERASYRPAGLGRFARSKGGPLEDDPRANRSMTIERLEVVVAEMIAVGRGVMLEDLGLVCEAMGLAGFPNFAVHDYGWIRALGGRMRQLPISEYLHVGPILSLLLRLLGRDVEVPYPLGLERDGQVLLKPYCPPYYPSMEAAVRAVVDYKWGAGGVFRGRGAGSAWQDPAAVYSGVPPVGEAALAATIAYCEYVYGRYGRFPAYLPPLHTTAGFQANHLDLDFYDRFYRPEALTETHRAHLARWHPAEPG